MEEDAITVPATEEFSGKRILVTGGTKGAGKAIADRFLQPGGSVIVAAHSAPVERGGAYCMLWRLAKLIQHEQPSSHGYVLKLSEDRGQAWQDAVSGT